MNRQNDGDRPRLSGPALIALQGLLDELDALGIEQTERIVWLDGEISAGDAEAARSAALEALARAGHAELVEAATQRLAGACLKRELPRAVRSAAYDALVALLARDRIRPATFHLLYGRWETAVTSDPQSSLEDGEELLLHLG